MKKKIILLLITFGSVFNILGQTSKIITKVPFELEGNHIFIKVQINNSEQLDFIFDTGTGSTAINSETAKKINLPNNKETITSGASGKFEVQVAENNTVNVNGLQLTKVNLQKAPLLHLEKGLGRDIDGIIGYAILKNYVVKIDYDSFQIEIYNSKGFKYDGIGEIIKIKKGSHSSIKAQIKLNTEEVIKGEFVLDNGAGLALAFCTPFSEKNKIAEKFNKIYTSKSSGYSSNKVNVKRGKLKQLNINKFVFSNVPTSLYSVEKGFFADKKIAGVIGNEILKRYNITFDYKRKKSYWEPNTQFLNEPFEVSCSGLKLSLDETKMKVMIADIIPDSVGATSELEIGDEILKINEIEVKDLSLAKIEKILEQDGKTVEIIAKRKNSISTTILKLKALI